MINPISVATEGFLGLSTTLSITTEGFLSALESVTQPVIGGRSIAFHSAALQWKAVRKLKRKLAYHRKDEIDELLSREVIEEVTESMVRDWDLDPTIKEYEIDHAEAEKRLREFIEQYIRQIQDDEIALLLILMSM